MIRFRRRHRAFARGDFIVDYIGHTPGPILLPLCIGFGHVFGKACSAVSLISLFG